MMYVYAESVHVCCQEGRETWYSHSVESCLPPPHQPNCCSGAANTTATRNDWQSLAVSTMKSG
jgi:hypothetical protein